MFGVLKLFRTQANRGADYEALVETECPECYIKISGFKDTDKERTDNYVYISNFTAHNENAMSTWKWRRTRIWRILRGISDPDYEILTPQVMDAVIKAMIECREILWSNQPNVDVKGGPTTP